MPSPNTPEFVTKQPVKSTGGPVTPSSQCSSKSVITFDFVDSPLSHEWQDRVSKKLNDMSDEFAQHNLDFGRTYKLKHPIKLYDETPFNKECVISTLMIWQLFDSIYMS